MPWCGFLLGASHHLPLEFLDTADPSSLTSKNKKSRYEAPSAAQTVRCHAGASILQRASLARNEHPRTRPPSSTGGADLCASTIRKHAAMQQHFFAAQRRFKDSGCARLSVDMCAADSDTERRGWSRTPAVAYHHVEKRAKLSNQPTQCSETRTWHNASTRILVQEEWH